MKAMVFAAGLGSRLRPYTNDRPKALVEVEGMSLLEIVLRRLKFHGFREVVVNVHHYADQVIEFLESKADLGLQIQISDERELLLETGGGLQKAADCLSDGPFLVHNVDILADLPLDELFQQHVTSGVMATLAVTERSTSRYFQFSPEGQLVGWRNARTGEVKTSREEARPQDRAFSGIYVLDPAIFKYFPTDKQVFSTVEVLLAAAHKEKVLAYPHDASHWLDVGKPESLAMAPAMLAKLPLA